MASASEVERYRADVAKLLVGSIAWSARIERWLDDAVDGSVVSERAALEADPAKCDRGPPSQPGLQRAHLLAVQARPVLECAGQVVAIRSARDVLIR